MVITTPKEAILAKTPPIGGLVKTIKNGELFVKAVMVNIISDLVLFLNVGKTMNEQQIGITADMLIKKYNYFKIEDYKLLFDRIKIGYYGKQYDRVDGQTIFECANQYDLERAELAEEMSYNSHTNKKLESPNLIHPEVAQMYKEVLKIQGERSKMVPTDIKLAEPGAKTKYEANWVDESEIENQLEEKRKAEKKLIEKSPRDKFIQMCFSYFDKIHQKTPVKDPKGNITRFIEYNGKVVDQVEYTELKLAEALSKGEDLKL